MKRAKTYPFLHLQQQRLSLFVDAQTQTDVPHKKQFFTWVWHALKNDYRLANISILLADEASAQNYNQTYRHKNYATNVLSFALNEESDIAIHGDALQGDLVLCPAVIAREAMTQNKTLIAHYAHLTLHGVLHLMGYDHIDDKDAAQMEAQEIKLMAQIGYDNPYIED